MDVNLNGVSTFLSDNFVVKINTGRDLSAVFAKAKVENIPIFIHFYTDWNFGDHEHALELELEKIAKLANGSALFCKIEKGEFEKINGSSSLLRFRIRTMPMPTVLHLNADGKEVTRKVTPESIVKHLRSFFLEAKDSETL